MSRQCMQNALAGIAVGYQALEHGSDPDVSDGAAESGIAMRGRAALAPGAGASAESPTTSADSVAALRAAGGVTGCLLPLALAAIELEDADDDEFPHSAIGGSFQAGGHRADRSPRSSPGSDLVA